MNLPAISAIEKTLIAGDLSALSPEQKVSFLKATCDSLGLNYLTKPFEFITLNGKLTMYAKRDATDQLRKIHKISVTITGRDKVEDIYIVTAKAKNADGREDESTGAVNIAGLKGDNLANALMKAETKAKRRVTLSICGLGVLDESEIETIPNLPPPIVPPVNPLKEIKAAKAVASNDPGEFVCSFGKYKGQKISSIDQFDLNNYCEYIVKSAEQSQKAISGQVADFMTAAHLFLQMSESRPQEQNDLDLALAAQ